ncbi:FAD-dependent oxidoreductase [Marinomonas fungiae]|uniref:FAD-dependent oxidoreductase n=1 Tax=Marinomonas fungiae TaxID=1137284 RepID=UPI003A8E2990
MFSQSLKKECESLGVEFKFNTSIERILVEQGQVRSVIANEGDVSCEQLLVCLGSYSKEMLKAIGLDVPIYPVKGYSLTVPITDQTYAPTSTIMDETYKVAVTRLGDRIRAAVRLN